MQKPLHTLLFTLILCSACFSQGQLRERPKLPAKVPANSVGPVIETKEGASITATTDKAEYPGTESVKLTIALKNTGARPFGILFEDVEYCYFIEVTGPNGKKLPFRNLRPPSYNPLSGPGQSRFVSLVLYPVRPGQTKRAVVWLSNLFDMSTPGSYTVTVSKTFRMGPEKRADQVFIDIKSQPMTVKVTSAPPLSQWLD